MHGSHNVTIKFKIAHIITRLDRGGSAENTLFTARFLDKSRYDVSLIYGETVEGLENEMQEAERDGVKMIYVRELLRHLHPWADVVAFFKLYAILRKEKYDIVHTHSSKAGALGRLAASLAGSGKIVHTPHGHVFYGYFGPLTNRFVIFIERVLGKITDRLITLTERGKEEHVALKIMPAEKIIPVYSGIVLENFRNFNALGGNLPPVLKNAPKGFRIGLLARLVPVKGHRVLLDAVPHVIRSVPEALFFLAGDGPLRKDLERECRKRSIISSVFFLGNLEDARSFIHEMDLLVLPSLNEGMGRVLLEAQAMGKPVIGTRVGGIPEVIREGETGLVVPPQDPEALANAILKLLKDEKKRQAMGEAARRWVDEKFGVHEMVTKISRLYEELLQES